MKWTLENKICSGLGLALMIVVVILSITCRVATCFIQDTDWVTHSHKVMEALNDLRSTMQDIEMGGRGWAQVEVNKGATFHFTLS